MGAAKNVFLILVLGIMFPKHATSTNSALFKTRENTRLNGHVVKQFQSPSFMSCNHWCLRNSWCTSTNFRELSEVNKKGTCELNKHGYVDQNTNLDDQKGVTFSLLVKGHHLRCAAGLTGPLCEYDINECSPNPCYNGGSCRDLVNGFKCNCPRGFLGTLCDIAASECNQYKILNDSDRHNDFGRGDQKCDKNLTEDWYRFSAGAGTSIATQCIPGALSCGTNFPGWMKGAHPTVDEGVVSRKVCFSGYGNCCYHNIMINVRNCSSFFVYRLKPIQVCASRYCGKS